MGSEGSILHVDDEPSFADLTRMFLERDDGRFVIRTATSAEEGLERLDDCPPDCIVSDYNVPGTDGLELLRTVREEHPNLPFLLFTGKGSEEVASDAIAVGVTDYLQRNPGTEQYELLANRIRNAVEHGGDDVAVHVGGFYVTDIGPGIPESECEAVFEAGYSTSEEGTGYGLRIVKQIIDAHG